MRNLAPRKRDTDFSYTFSESKVPSKVSSTQTILSFFREQSSTKIQMLIFKRLRISFWIFFVFFLDFFCFSCFVAGAVLCGPCKAHFVAGAGLCGPWSAEFVAGAGLFVGLEVQISWQV